jgi:hypothetical protein
MPSRLRVASLTLLVLAMPTLAVSLTLTGTVRAEDTHSGVPGLALKLTPPSDSGQPNVVTSTDQAGAYAFRNLKPGEYLFEVQQGTTVLFRTTLTLNQDTQRDVQVRRP